MAAVNGHWTVVIHLEIYMYVPIENDLTQIRELNKQLYSVARFFRPHVLSAAAIRPKKEEEKKRRTLISGSKRIDSSDLAHQTFHL